MNWMTTSLPWPTQHLPTSNILTVPIVTFTLPLSLSEVKMTKTMVIMRKVKRTMKTTNAMMFLQKCTAMMTDSLAIMRKPNRDSLNTP